MWQSAILLLDNLWAAYHFYQLASYWHCTLWSPAMPRLWIIGSKVAKKKKKVPNLPLTQLNLINFSQILFLGGAWEILLLLKQRHLSSSGCMFLFSFSPFIVKLVDYFSFVAGAGKIPGIDLHMFSFLSFFF
jgi:hypothetical protein